MTPDLLVPYHCSACGGIQGIFAYYGVPLCFRCLKDAEEHCESFEGHMTADRFASWLLMTPLKAAAGVGEQDA